MRLIVGGSGIRDERQVAQHLQVIAIIYGYCRCPTRIERNADHEMIISKEISGTASKTKTILHFIS